MLSILLRQNRGGIHYPKLVISFPLVTKIGHVDRLKKHPVPTRSFSVENVLEIVVPLGILSSCYSFMNYEISNPNQYLVRTGLGIKDIQISKKCVVLRPLQRVTVVDLTPQNYSFNLQAMSNQKMEFHLPGVFTIGPKDDSEELKKYCKLMLDLDNNKLIELIKGVIEGETRVLSASMTIDEIFNDRSMFKDLIIKNVQSELDQFGLQIFNANIKELQDTPGSEYFSFLRQKTRSEAEGLAKVDTAEAKKKADIGQKDREVQTRVQISTLEATAIENENENKKRVSQSTAEFKIVEAENNRRMKIAQIEGEKLGDIRYQELEKEVESKRYSTELESRRANDLSQINIEAEGVKLKADADLYTKEKQAEASYKMYQAQSEGLKKMMETLDQKQLMQYLMLDRGLYQDLAKTNSEAIKGLNPKITVWQTGGGNENIVKPIRDILQAIPPIFTTIQDQTDTNLLGHLLGSSSSKTLTDFLEKK